MKFAILGDTHFGMRGDSLDFHNYSQKFYEDFFKYLSDNGIHTIIQLGDLFDRRKFINFNSLHLCRKYFFDRLEEFDIDMITLLGNHDIAFKNTLEVNSSQLLLNDYEHVRVIDSFSTIDPTGDGVLVDIVPWICDENREEIFNQIKQSKSQICFGHFEVSGFEMDRGSVCHDGIDRKSLSKYDMVITGHFHHRSDDGHIYYVGTPGEMTWADYNDPRGFHIFDLKTRELEFIQNPYRMFHKVIYDDSKEDFEFWKKYDYGALKETYVKVVVLNKQNPYLFDTVLDNLYKSGASDISIVEDFSDNLVEIDQEIVDQAEDTMTILSHFIDNSQLNVETDKLKTLMRELYVEALNTEKAE
jgi:DNA repair exonuclease SbcCD nuclease subunit